MVMSLLRGWTPYRFFRHPDEAKAVPSSGALATCFWRPTRPKGVTRWLGRHSQVTAAECLDCRARPDVHAERIQY